MEQGSYVGNGTDNRDIPLTFTPALALVIPHNTASPALDFDSTVYSSTMSSSGGMEMTGGADLTTIKSFQPNAFRIGTNASVNNSGNTYTYIAWKSVAGRMATGSFTGNGSASLAITAVGFQPEYLWVQTAVGGKSLAHKSNATGNGVDLTLLVTATATVTNNIKSLDATGFTVGSDIRVNPSGGLVHWMAFK